MIFDLLFLPTAREGNGFRGVCYSVHNQPYGYSATAHPCYHPQRSCGKVIFSQACVKNSVHRGGGACMAGGVWWGLGHAWQRGTCVARGICGRKNCNCSGRYASYWNSFLLIIFHWWLVRVTLVVAFGFFAQNFGRWWDL